MNRLLVVEIIGLYSFTIRYFIDYAVLSKYSNKLNLDGEKIIQFDSPCDTFFVRRDNGNLVISLYDEEETIYKGDQLMIKTYQCDGQLNLCFTDTSWEQLAIRIFESDPLPAGVTFS